MTAGMIDHRTAVSAWIADLTTADAADLQAVKDALDYLCVAQLYLHDNVLLERPLSASDVQPAPAGHWGVGPPVNAVLAALAPLRHRLSGDEVMIVHGAGHAGPSALAMSYLSGELGRRYPRFAWSRDALERLVREFPRGRHGLGTEIGPQLPHQLYMGGQLGGSLAFSCGAALDAPGRLVVPLIGDGECETGILASAWLGADAMHSGGSSGHGIVLPVVLVNGLRMGDRSLLGRMSAGRLRAYFAGLGWTPHLVDGRDVGVLRDTLAAALAATGDLAAADRHVVVVTMPKGLGGPERVEGRQIQGTPQVHKTPLKRPRENAAELAALGAWLTRYRPAALIDPDGAPATSIRRALRPTRPPAPADPTPDVRPDPAGRGGEHGGAFATAVLRSLGRRRRPWRVFSPDELTSNTLDPRHPVLTDRSIEVLNEELCHLWLQGYLETGRTGLFISYEAFAVLNTSLVRQYAKYRRLAAGSRPVASCNYLLTSLGWNNTYTHQDQTFLTAVLDCGFPKTSIYLPADDLRLEATLDRVMDDSEGLNVIVAGKYYETGTRLPADTIATEIETGYSILSGDDPDADPDIVLVGIGDVAHPQLSRAAALLRAGDPHRVVRQVVVHDLAAFGVPEARRRFSPADERRIFGQRSAVVVASSTTATPVRALLFDRAGLSERCLVRGYVDPGRHISGQALLEHCGLDARSLAAAAEQLLQRRDTSLPAPRPTEQIGEP
ncbi:phosphoketolase [Micromonospora echinofusca]|uniref:Xylulose-5-phosphate/fructose-6-phosphate phosphoketolase n=1 Tax=Micromonospora echinofusca TaxID=47858 RepID=A0A1C5GI15_MICEH|nr:phosphoketolase [Micromonospora echinofusca]SCG19463.1 xylulose-5-phosphate/fructose-6-phosphate phosphoketolase [Micromonospora echinofusca]